MTPAPLPTAPAAPRSLRFAAAAILAISLTVVALLGWLGVSQPSVDGLLRLTARVSVLLFSAAVLVAGLPRWGGWQPPLALAFAGSHTVHLALIVLSAAISSRPQMLRDPVGALAYLGVLAIAIHAVARIRGLPLPVLVRRAVPFAYAAVWLTFLGFYLRPWVLKGEPPSPLAFALLGLLLVSAAVTAWRLMSLRRRESRS